MNRQNVVTENHRMEWGRRGIAGILIMVLFLGVGTLLWPKNAYAAAPEITVESKDNVAPRYEAGKAKVWTLIVTNHTDADMENLIIAPEMGETGKEWPFQTEYQNYRQTISVPAQSAIEVPFEFTQRMDAPTARYRIAFVVTAVNGDGAEEVKASQKFYVNTTAKEQPNEEPSGTNGGDQSQSGGTGADIPAEAGGFSNGEAAYSGGGGSGSASVPRVIVTGFSTNPEQVQAGSNFTLTIHLRNTSKSTRVSNMLFDLSAPTEGADEQTAAPAFLPASGSSSIYLDGIPAGQTADISIQLNAKADLLQKPYSIDMSMLYEDAQASQIEAASSISIPVKQAARFEFSEFEISPESIAVGDEANVMCNLYNMGRTKLYNVKAIFEGAGIEKEELFIGNVESGASASIDVMLEGKKVTKGPAKVTMKLTYEDEAGNQSETKKELKLETTEAEADVSAMQDTMPEESGGLPIVPIVVLVIIVAAVVTAVILIRKRNKKRLENEEEELLYELDGPSEDER